MKPHNRDPALHDKLDLLIQLVRGIARAEVAQMGALDDIDVAITDLQASADAAAAGEATAIAILDGLAAKVDALLASGGDPTAILAKIAALNDNVKAGTANLAAAADRDARP